MLQRLPAGADEAPRMAALVADAERLIRKAKAQRALAVPRPEPPQYGALQAAVRAFTGAPLAEAGAAAGGAAGALGSAPRVLALLADLEVRLGKGSISYPCSMQSQLAVFILYEVLAPSLSTMQLANYVLEPYMPSWLHAWQRSTHARPCWQTWRCIGNHILQHANLQSKDRYKAWYLQCCHIGC